MQCNEEHMSHVLSSLNDMRSTATVCDFKIKVRNKTFKTHRLILAVNSGYFKELFSRRGRLESEITMENVEPIDMQQCIDYMYTSKCEFKLESVPKLLEIAHIFQIQYLEEDCWNIVMDHLNPENSLYILDLSRKLEKQDVEKVAKKMVQDNLAIAMSSELFSKVKKKDLLKFIEDAKPGIYWKAITTYCRNRGKVFLKLMEHLDVSKFPLEFLIGTILIDPLTNYKLPQSRLFVVKAIFSDMTRFEEQINSENCFLLKMFICDPNYAGFICPSAIRIIGAFLEKNFPLIIARKEFCCLSKEELLFLLRSPKVNSQESKWEGIFTWIRCDPRNRVPSFQELFCTIQLDQLSLKFLKEKVYPQHLVKYDSVCMKRLMKATIEIVNRLQSKHAEDEMLDISPESESHLKAYTILDAAREYAKHLKLDLVRSGNPDCGNDCESQSDDHSNQPSGSIKVKSTMLPVDSTAVGQSHVSDAIFPKQSVGTGPSHSLNASQPSPNNSLEGRQSVCMTGGDTNHVWGGVHSGHPAGVDPSIVIGARFPLSQAHSVHLRYKAPPRSAEEKATPPPTGCSDLNNFTKTAGGQHSKANNTVHFSNTTSNPSHPVVSSKLSTYGNKMTAKDTHNLEQYTPPDLPLSSEEDLDECASDEYQLDSVQHDSDS